MKIKRKLCLRLAAGVWYITRFESSMKGFMRSTVESRNKPRNRNVDETDQEKKRPPLISPRLCEENYPPKNLDLQIEINRHYDNHPQKYDDPAQAQPMENETYFQTLPQDEFDDSDEHKPRPPSGSSSSKKPRKQRLVTPKSSDKNEEYREKAEFGIEKISKPLEAKMIGYEEKQSKMFRKGINEYKQMHEVSAEREKKTVKQQTKLEEMCKKMGKYKKVNDALSEKSDKMEDRIRKLQTKLDHLERVGETHHLCVEIQDWQSRYIKELEYEVEAQDQNFVLLQDEYDKLNCSYSTMKAEIAKVKYLQTELDAKTEEVNKLTRQITRMKDLSHENKHLKLDKENAEHKINKLSKTVQERENEIESLVETTAKAEENVHRMKKIASAGML